MTSHQPRHKQRIWNVACIRPCAICGKDIKIYTNIPISERTTPKYCSKQCLRANFLDHDRKKRSGYMLKFKEPNYEDI